MVIDATFWGAGAAGVIIGFLTYYCLTRFQAIEPATLTMVVGLIFAGVAVTFIANNLSPNKDAYAVYIIGVLIGMVVYFILKALNIGPTIADPS